ncbi:hypothetical protein BD414DRAFT_478618 [Trametes punicea]|nr:hypothetical protein BD414DRAFT_478618 [Trametes punicea]
MEQFSDIPARSTSFTWETNVAAGTCHSRFSTCCHIQRRRILPEAMKARLILRCKGTMVDLLLVDSNGNEAEVTAFVIQEDSDDCTLV